MSASIHKGTLSGCLAVIGLIALAGCASEEPMRAELDDLKSKVERLQADQAKTARDAAKAVSASSAANRAQATADKAAASAQTTAEALAALDQKIDRMFKRPASKSAD
jgi:outer membrane murein-binding lipoprotein Lpp